MSNPVYPCLWFDGNASEAAHTYISWFDNAKILSENPIVSQIEVDGHRLMLLNGGPQYRHNPSISLFVTCDEESEVRKLWSTVSRGGTVMMDIGRYDWSPCYGWCNDHFGVSWQIYQGSTKATPQKIVPCLLFTDARFGLAQEAIEYYCHTIDHSVLDGIMHYHEGSGANEGKVLHAQFTLRNCIFMAMDGPGEHHFGFTPAASFVIECKDQEEIDRYWQQLGEGGRYSQCGWLEDRYGVSWQIVPAILGELMNDPERATRVTAAFLKMQKFDIAALLSA